MHSSRRMRNRTADALTLVSRSRSRSSLKMSLMRTLLSSHFTPRGITLLDCCGFCGTFFFGGGDLAGAGPDAGFAKSDGTKDPFCFLSGRSSLISSMYFSMSVSLIEAAGVLVPPGDVREDSREPLLESIL